MLNRVGRSAIGPALRALLVLVCVAPALLGAQPAAARPCATMAMRALLQRGNPLLGGLLGDRPAGEVTAFVDGEVHPVRVHYGTDTSEERAQLVRAALEEAWDLQVLGAGFDPPLPDGARGGDDRFDAYVVSLSPGVGARTFAEEDASDTDGKHASPAFLEISPVLDDEALVVFTHHEFQHALQFALDRDETIGFLESTAVFFEARARPEIDLWHDAVPAFQALPFVPPWSHSALIDDAFSVADPRFEYGAALLALYIDEVHGDGQGSVFATLLRGAEQADAVEDNEPDWLDALVDDVGVDPADVVADFATWRALVGTLAVDGDGPAETFGNDALLATRVLALEALDGAPTTTADAEDGPYPGGCVVRAFTAPAQAPLPLRIEVEGAADHVVALAVLAVVPDSGVASRRELGARGGAIAADVEVPAGALAHVSFCDVTPADADAPLVHAPVTFSILRTDVEWPDAGPEPTPDAGPDVDDPPPPEPACGCSAAKRAPPLAVLGLMGLAALVRRRRPQTAP